MPATLEAHAKEQSTYVITATCTDEDDAPVTPKTMTWTLTDGAGNVINQREDVNVSNPSSSEDIVLKGDDLALQAGETTQGLRIFTIEATYDSDLGTDLPLNGSIRFILDNLMAVS